MSESVGQTVVVENRAGVSGIVGTEAVARAAPDGYTIAYTVGSDLVLRKYVSKTFRLDALRDFTPIAPAIESVSCIAVNDSVPVNSIKEFIDYAKRNPGKLSFGSAGVGSSQHLTGELFRMQGIDMLHVPYQGLGAALQGLLGVMVHELGHYFGLPDLYVSGTGTMLRKMEQRIAEENWACQSIKK